MSEDFRCLQILESESEDDATVKSSARTPTPESGNSRSEQVQTPNRHQFQVQTPNMYKLCL